MKGIKAVKDQASGGGEWMSRHAPANGPIVIEADCRAVA